MNPAFRALAGARVVSFIGDSVSPVALMLYVADTAGQALAVSFLLLVGDFVPSLLSPLTGSLSDRLNRKRVMVACEVGQGAVLVLIASTLPPLPVLLALVAVRATIGQVFAPASSAAVPALVRDRDPESANSTIGFGTNGGEAIGPFIAAAFCVVMAFNGIDDVALVMLATETLGAADFVVGLLLGAVGVGLLLGYLGLAR